MLQFDVLVSCLTLSAAYMCCMLDPTGQILSALQTI